MGPMWVLESNLGPLQEHYILLVAELLSSLMEFSYNTYIDILPKDKGNLKTNLNMNIFISILIGGERRNTNTVR